MEFNEEVHKLVLNAVMRKISTIHHEDRSRTVIDYIHPDNRESIHDFGEHAVSPDVVTPIEGTARDTCGDGTSLFALDAPVIKWPKFPIHYVIDPANSSVDDYTATSAIIDAFQTFNDEQNAIVFNRTTDISQANISVSFKPIDGSGATAAYCNYNWNPINEILSAQIVLDNNEIWYTSAVERCNWYGNALDIQNVLTHEIGHALGFAHNTDPLSTMYPYVETGETLRRTLSLGDRAGFHTLYGPAKITYPVESTYGPIIINGTYNYPIETLNVIGVGTVRFRTAFLDAVRATGYGLTRAYWYLHYDAVTKTYTKVINPPN